jgi:hypothetical protein
MRAQHTLGQRLSEAHHTTSHSAGHLLETRASASRPAGDHRALPSIRPDAHAEVTRRSSITVEHVRSPFTLFA